MTSDCAASLHKATLEYRYTARWLYPPKYQTFTILLTESRVDIKMGVIGTFYANILLSIADISVMLFAPTPEVIAGTEHYQDLDGSQTRLEYTYKPRPSSVH